MFQGMHIAEGGFPITPGTSFSPTALSIYVGGGGDLEVTTVKNETVTLPNVPTGTWVSIAVKSVESANTTATGLVGVY